VIHAVANIAFEVAAVVALASLALLWPERARIWAALKGHDRAK
jgi:hypothetical protein